DQNSGRVSADALPGSGAHAGVGLLCGEHIQFVTDGTAGNVDGELKQEAPGARARSDRVSSEFDARRANAHQARDRNKGLQANSVKIKGASEMALFSTAC